jgi:hypothetical protein
MTSFTPGTDAARAAVRLAHVEYLKSRSDVLLAAGVLMGEASPHGSLIIVDTEERAHAQALAEGDPFFRAGLLSEVKVMPWRKAFFDREFVG